MANMTATHLARIVGRHPPPPAVFVESGTFHGKTTRLAVAQFRDVYTIELHPDLYAEAVKDLGPLGVSCFHGDSAVLVPHLATSIVEPIAWYLDAHWFKRTAYKVAGEQEGLPLWKELDAIAKRPWLDVVIVDDVHAMGKSDPTPEWLDVSLEKIASYFPGHREAAIMGDQAVVWR